MRLLKTALWITLLGALVSQCAAGRMRRDATTVGPREGGASGVSDSDADRGQRSPAARRKSREEARKPHSRRLVIYTGRLTLRTPSVARALQQVETATRALGGEVQSSSGGRPGRPAVIVVRVPSARFDEAIRELSKIGTLISRNISAQDVTRQFSDLKRRLRLAEQTRARLDLLLKRSGNIAERIKILREVRRLTERIEKMRSASKVLKERAAKATITVRLRPLPPEQLSRLRSSAFGWVRLIGSQSPQSAAADGARVRFFSMESPAGFFDYRERARAGRSNRLFLSADGVAVQAFRFRNEPRADLAFWKEAVRLELVGRGYEVEQKSSNQSVTVWKYEAGGRVRILALAILVQDDSIYVLDAHFPGEEQFEKRGATVLRSLASFKPRKPGLLEVILSWF